MKLKPRLSYANVTATLALIAAVAGGTAAVAGVAKAPKNSVVAKSVKDGNITAKELAGVVASSASTNITDTGAYDNAPAFGGATARCPAGARAIAGGGTAGGNAVALQNSRPVGNNSWTVSAVNDNGTTTQVSAYVLCLPASPARPYRVP